MSIKHVRRFLNDMVMVFDDLGQQMPEYQGEYKNIRKKILSNTNHFTKFSVDSIEGPNYEISKNEF